MIALKVAPQNYITALIMGPQNLMTSLTSAPQILDDCYEGCASAHEGYGKDAQAKQAQANLWDGEALQNKLRNLITMKDCLIRGCMVEEHHSHVATILRA